MMISNGRNTEEYRQFNEKNISSKTTYFLKKYNAQSLKSRAMFQFTFSMFIYNITHMVMYI